MGGGRRRAWRRPAGASAPTLNALQRLGTPSTWAKRPLLTSALRAGPTQTRPQRALAPPPLRDALVGRRRRRGVGLGERWVRGTGHTAAPCERGVGGQRPEPATQSRPQAPRPRWPLSGAGGCWHGKTAGWEARRASLALPLTRRASLGVPRPAPRHATPAHAPRRDARDCRARVALRRIHLGVRPCVVPPRVLSRLVHYRFLVPRVRFPIPIFIGLIFIPRLVFVPLLGACVPAEAVLRFRVSVVNRPPCCSPFGAIAGWCALARRSTACTRRLEVRLPLPFLLVRLLLASAASWLFAIEGRGDAPTRRALLPSWVRARRLLSLFGSASRTARQRSAVGGADNGGARGGGGRRGVPAGTSDLRGRGQAAGGGMATRTEDSDLRDAPGVGRAPSLQANGNLVDHSMAMGATTASQRAVAKAAQDFLEDLTVRMRRMDKPPQSTFRHSYGGEFEVRLRLLLEPLGVLCGCLFDRAAALLGAV